MQGVELYFKQLEVGPMANFCYLVGTRLGAAVVAIDPSWEPDQILSQAGSDGREIVAIFLTHTHFDHVMAIDKLADRDIPVYVHALEVEVAKEMCTCVTGVAEGEIIDAAGLKVMCLHTPGHTRGSVCYLVGNYLFTGDTLFVDSCGRVDLPESNPDDMVNSLRRLSQLDEGIVVCPGHNYGHQELSTIGEQKKTNACLGARARDLI